MGKLNLETGPYAVIEFSLKRLILFDYLLFSLRS